MKLVVTPLEGAAESDEKTAPLTRPAERIATPLPVTPPAQTPRASGDGGAGPTLLALGEVLAERYRIVRFIARGGMGEVYEAEDAALHERVALKAMQQELAQDATSIELFKSEVQLARKVSHPGVCRIHDFGTHRTQGERAAEVVFLTMELLAGETLAARLRREQKLPVAEVRRLLGQLAAALDAAHAAGVVHRDLKHENVMLVGPAQESRAVITDFGIAGRAGTHPGGFTLGTPLYIAPEELIGAQLTPAADLFSLGVILYRALTGVFPFPKADASERLTATPRRPSALEPSLSPRWDEALLRCLAREPTDRFASAGALVEFIDAPELASARPPSTRWWLTGFAALVLAGLLGGLVWQRSHAVAPTDATPRVAIQVRPSIAITSAFDRTHRPEVTALTGALPRLLAAALEPADGLRLISDEELRRALFESHATPDAELTQRSREQVRVSAGASLVLEPTLGMKGKDFELEVKAIEPATGRERFALTEHGPDVTGIATRLAASVARKLHLTLSAPATMMDAEGLRDLTEALSDLRGKERTRGLARLQDLARRTPKDAALQLELARQYASWGRLAEQRLALQRANALSQGLPPEERLRIESAYAIGEGDFAAASDRLRELLQMHPDALDVALLRADTLVRAGRLPEAQAQLSELEALPAPLVDDPRIDLARSKAQGGSTELLQRAIDKAQRRGERLLHAQAQQELSRVLTKQGHVNEALAAIEPALPVFDEWGDRFLLAQALGEAAALQRDRGALGLAVELLKRAKQVDGDLAGAAPARAREWLHADALVEAGRLHKALKIVEPLMAEALAQTDAREDGPLVLARVFAAGGELQRAKELLQRFARSAAQESSPQQD
ncbi:MAG: protein kinase, partial [Deltaproteobacteria bacterium]|nr:protein kinase [Deltaproteobacteria bacterium]